MVSVGRVTSRPMMALAEASGATKTATKMRARSGTLPCRGFIDPPSGRRLAHRSPSPSNLHPPAWGELLAVARRETRHNRVPKESGERPQNETDQRRDYDRIAT